MSGNKIILGIKAKNNIKMNVLPPSLSLTDVERAEKAAEIAIAQAAISVEKASEASQSAKKAADSENNAADSEIMAEKWAQSVESPDGTAGNKSAKTWAEEAAESAAAALDSKNAAATSESNAAGSAEEAAESAAAALDSKNAAATSESNAAGSAEEAAESAAVALDSKNAAAQSAQQAAEIAGGIGNPVVDVYENNGIVTVEKSDGTSNNFTAGINMLGRNKTYNYGDIAYSSNLPTWAYLYCVQAGATAGSEPDFSGVTAMGQYIADGSVKWIVDDVRFNMPVGVVFYDSYLHDGCVKYNGATVQREDYIRLEKIANDKNLWTENPADEPWKFGVGDGGTTMVLPDFRNRFIEGGDSAQKIEAGLPNIVGRFGFCVPSATCGWNTANDSDTNPFYNLSGAGDGGAARSLSSGGAGFDASRYNAIFGASQTVQPPAIQLIPQIKY